MKNIYLLALLLVLSFQACEKVKVGYLKADNAEYSPNELTVRKTPDPVIDAVRIANESPWVTVKIQGVLGTDPLYYEITGVKATEGGDEEAFMKEVTIRGGGIMELPLQNSVPPGKYLVSLKVHNEDYSALLPDRFTFIVI